MGETLLTAIARSGHLGVVCAASVSDFGLHFTTEVDDDPSANCNPIAAITFYAPQSINHPRAHAYRDGNQHGGAAMGFFPFPANGAWDVAYHAAFSRGVLVSRNETKFDFDGFKALYTSFNETIGRNFIDFWHAFIKALGVPSLRVRGGGFVYLTGWEGGLTALGTELYAEDAAFWTCRLP
ncbi:hypothetical protein DL764_007102 [Monosporascus ibericus]|uniref:Uncharacterized protein n=1 Tax=Monosporascus ibericus TaxID=155417 RepID=A0A4Q4T318_9PEZI|nr:hypothetical protein DL764_007102 [Monosporascus ibericus]